MLPLYKRRKASSSLLSTAERQTRAYVKRPLICALTRRQNICRTTATPSFPRSGSWSHLHFPSLHLHLSCPSLENQNPAFDPRSQSGFLSFPPFSLGPWTWRKVHMVKSILQKLNIFWELCWITVGILRGPAFRRRCRQIFSSFFWPERDTSTWATMGNHFPSCFDTWVGVIALFIIWNSFFVMNPSLSLSRACKGWDITIDCEFACR